MESEKGLIVRALAGRDKGRFFAVLEAFGDYVLIADGKTRKLANPKKKNVKHLSKTGKKIALTQITDKKLRDLLKEYTI